MKRAPRTSADYLKANWNEWAKEEVEWVVYTLHDTGFMEIWNGDRSEDAVFRLTATGRWALLDQALPGKANGGAPEAIFQVQPNMELLVTPSACPDAIVSMLSFTEPIRIETVARLRITPASLRRGLDRGGSLKQFRAILEKSSKSGLPENVSKRIQELEQREGEIELVPCGSLVRFRDSALVDAVIRSGALGPAAAGRYDPQTLLLRRGVGVPLIAKALRKAGYLPRVVELVPGRKAAGDSSESASHEVTPIEGVVYEPREVRDLIRRAAEEGHDVEIRCYSASSSRRSETHVIEPEEIEDDVVTAYCWDHNCEQNFQLDRIQAARLVESA